MRNRRGGSIAEFAAALSMLIPLLMLIAMAAYEGSQAYAITTSLGAAARKAARDIAIFYGKDQTIATDGTKQASVTSNIVIGNMVKSPAQFTINFIPNSTNPTDVQVRCVYLGPPTNPPFPNPDPFGMNGMFTFSQESVYRLE